MSTVMTDLMKNGTQTMILNKMMSVSRRATAHQNPAGMPPMPILSALQQEFLQITS